MTRSDRTELLGSLLALTVLMNEDMDRGMRRLGLTPPRAHVIWLLVAHGPSTQRALAQQLAVSPRNVTGLVDALVDTGFVTREPHPSDRRATLVTLTARGRRTGSRMTAEHAEFAQLLFGELDDARLEVFGACLTHLTERLAAALGTPP